MTPAGQQAEDIARWAWQDPAERVEDAQRQIAELYSSTQDPAARLEISGTAQMLSRLAGTVVHTDGILDQLQGQQ